MNGAARQLSFEGWHSNCRAVRSAKRRKRTGGPSAEQRASLKVTMAGRSVRTAVVSDSIKIRFTIATIALINREHHRFGNRELRQAYDFLQLTPAERGDVERALKQLGELMTETASKLEPSGAQQYKRP